MTLFSCKFEATIGGDSGQQRNIQANRRQPDNEANRNPPNNENRLPDNEENNHQPNNDNRQPDRPANPDPQPNNPENPHPPNRGNRHPNNPENPHPPNRGNRQPYNPENADPENDENNLYNRQVHPGPLNVTNFGEGDTGLNNSINRRMPLFVPQRDTWPNIGVAAGSNFAFNNKRLGGNMVTNPSKILKLDNAVVPENGLRNDRIHHPDLSSKPQTPRNNVRFFNSNRDITIRPTTDEINERVRSSGSYVVWNLSFVHKVHGHIVFLGARDLSNAEPDLSKIVEFWHGRFALGPSIQHDPLLCILHNVSRDDLAKQVNKPGGTPNDEEMYRILTALGIVANAKCWSYNERNREWTFLTTERGNDKPGGLSKQEPQTSSNNENDDYDDDDIDDDDDVTYYK